MEGHNFQTYMITPLDINKVQLKSGRILEKKSPSVFIQEYERKISLKGRSVLFKKKNIKKTTPVHSDELKNVCIKIPLLQATKEIPIFAKAIRELSIKNQEGKEKK